jgi:hypothetical protein
MCPHLTVQPKDREFSGFFGSQKQRMTENNAEETQNERDRSSRRGGGRTVQDTQYSSRHSGKK